MTWFDEFPQIDNGLLRDLKRAIDDGFRSFTRSYGDAIEGLFDPLRHFLNWSEDLLTSTPWPIVLLIAAALAWLAKRYGPKIAGGGNLRMVGSLNIGGRERIMVVEVGDQWIVVGASPGRINALATMPKQEAGVQSTATLAGHGPSATSFSDWLKQTIDKRNAK